jgi:hypothetical protein
MATVVDKAGPSYSMNTPRRDPHIASTEVEQNLDIQGSQVSMEALPTADPHVAGRLWNNSGVVTVSAG